MPQEFLLPNQSLIDHLPDAVVVCDLNLHVRLMNPAGLNLLGMTLEQVVGRYIWDVVTFIDEQTEAPIEDIIQLAITSGQDETAGSQALLLGSDGLSELPIEAVARPLRNDNNETVGALLTIHDVRLARFSRRQLSWAASHDELTGLYNRAEFDRQANAYLLTAKRDNNRHCLVLIDLDHFRQFNEMSDHLEGDHLLINTAELLRVLLRANDGLFRNSGDQFLILLPNCPEETGQKIAENIRQQIENMQVSVNTDYWPVTASIGISMLHQQGADTVSQLLYEAESACYQAKNQGGNQVSIFNVVQSMQYANTLQQLKNAIYAGQFHLYYQKIEALDGGLPMCEIFIRRFDDEGNIYEPASFLSICERSGLIVELDAWVVRNLLDLLASCPHIMSAFSRIHINLSAYSFASKTFLDELQALFSNYALPDQYICFEVSESSILKNLPHAQLFMSSMSMLGCSFVVDDVDANLTAFDVYNSLPIDMLKIDSTLVEGLMTNASSSIIVEAIYALSQRFNKQTIAQHVQESTVKSYLQQIGVSYLQGYAIHEPESLEALF